MRQTETRVLHVVSNDEGDEEKRQKRQTETRSITQQMLSK